VYGKHGKQDPNLDPWVRGGWGHGKREGENPEGERGRKNDRKKDGVQGGIRGYAKVLDHTGST